METAEWTQEPPECPAWCSNGAEHLAFQLRSGSSYWHHGNRQVVRTNEVTPNLETVPCDVENVQRVQVDERGYYVHPIEVSVAGNAFSPGNARLLADIIARLADTRA